MQVISGYTIQHKIYESDNTLIFKAQGSKSGESVILKMSQNEYPTIAENNNFRKEYDLLKTIGGPSIREAFDFIMHDHRPVIVLEDFGGIPITDHLQKKKFTLKEALDLAVRITKSIGIVHSNHIIHKDINPSNLLWNDQANALKIIDFGISTKLSKEVQSIINPNYLEGTLQYISPEQSGRMNRSIDYRSDFYSLGVTLYEIITGHPPFQSKDPLELVHCHLAKQPQSPYDINPGFSKAFSNIIMKLISKNAEDRYQNIIGIRSDLEKCLELYENREALDFTIGENDVSEQFQMSEKIYGREEELSSLLQIHQNIINGKKECVFFSGPTGVGKSVLVNEIKKQIIESHSFFISGKYDRHMKNIPYLAIIQAIQELVRQLLAEDYNKLDQLKKKLQTAVGNIGQVIVDVIPEVELIIGKQSEVSSLPPKESRNRFNMVFQNFIRVFAQSDHPLVLFIDDLQWADRAGFNLIRTLLSDNSLTHFLFIGAYRDNDIDTAHPYLGFKEGLVKEGITGQNLTLSPLDHQRIQEMAADMLRCHTNKTTELSQLIQSKTGGNPFFVKEFLRKMRDDKLIFVSKQNGKTAWSWDITKIKNAKITDNVIDLMTGKIDRLNHNSLKVFKTASCIGIKFNLPLLSKVIGCSESETIKGLEQAIDEGLIVTIENEFRFVHDQVHEAAYLLLKKAGEEQKQHYEIGKTLLKQLDEHQHEDLLFNTADQLNKAVEMLSDEEKKLLLSINFKAGIRAKKSTAYEAASNFLEHCVSLLPVDSWESDYNTSFSIYMEKLECEFLQQNFSKADESLRAILVRADSVLDKTKIRIIQIQDPYLDNVAALEIGKKTLKELGIALPKKVKQYHIVIEMIKSKFRLKKDRFKKLINNDEITIEEKIKLIIKIMNYCIRRAIFVDPDLMALLLLKTVNLSLKYGNSTESPYSYVTYGALLADKMDDIENGYDIGRSSLQLAENGGSPIILSDTSAVYAQIVMQYRRPYRECLTKLEEARKLCLEAGSFYHGSYTYSIYLYFYLYSGAALSDILEYSNKTLPLIEKTKEYSSFTFFKIYRQCVLNLSGHSKNCILLQGHSFNEETDLDPLLQKGELLSLSFYSLCKLMVTYIFGDYGLGIKTIETHEKYLDAGLTSNIMFFYFQALIYASHYSAATRKSKKRYRKKINKIEKQYQIWANYNPDNFLSRYLLIQAENRRISDAPLVETIKLYDQSIAAAHKSRIVYEEAIANELASKYLVSEGLGGMARQYMTEAHYLYANWGSIPKANDLEKKYLHLISRQQLTGASSTATTILNTQTAHFNTQMDLSSILKASQTLSREFQLKGLLEKLTTILIENAGAQRGVIFENVDGVLLIRADNNTEQKPGVLKDIPHESSKDTPIPIVNYVAHSKKRLVFANVSKEEDYRHIQYIQNGQVKSVACFPILNKGKLIGIIYLENNLVEGAFTPERLEIVNLLSSQIAIF